MSQTFRTPPRQINFNSQRRLSPVGSQSLAQKGKPEDPQIRQHAVQLQQLGARLGLMQERLPKLTIPASKQNLEKQILALRQEMKRHQRALMELRGAARILLLSPLLTELSHPPPDLANLFRQQLAEIEAIYRVHQPLPQGLIPRLDTFTLALRSLYKAILETKRDTILRLLDQAKTSLTELTSRFWPQEGQALQNFWSCWDQILRKQFAPGETEDTFIDEVNQLSFTDISADPDPDLEPQDLKPSFESDGDLQISFDFSAKKSVVRNQMGITLNQTKKSYEEYLEEGFQAIDNTVNHHFENIDPLYQSVELFLEAISKDKSRYEAYFGLGYLYSLVQDLNHALYFLDVAWKISGDQAIWDMIEKVRINAGLCETVSI